MGSWELIALLLSKTTLKDGITDKINHCTKPGPVACLDAEEEEELVNFLFESSKMEYGKNKRELLQIADNNERRLIYL